MEALYNLSPILGRGPTGRTLLAATNSLRARHALAAAGSHATGANRLRVVAATDYPHVGTGALAPDGAPQHTSTFAHHRTGLEPSPPPRCKFGEERRKHSNHILEKFTLFASARECDTMERSLRAGLINCALNLSPNVAPDRDNVVRRQFGDPLS
jgi:hypothetical protein